MIKYNLLEIGGHNVNEFLRVTGSSRIDENGHLYRSLERHCVKYKLRPFECL